MKKAIKITILIAVIIFLCGSVFYGFVKYRDNITYRTEIEFAKNVLMQPILADHPNNKWVNNLGGRFANNPESAFWFFKIWFVEADVSQRNIEKGILKFPAHSNDGKLIFDLYYKKDTPSIQCEIFRTPSGNKVQFSFPLNNCLFNPDYNHDEKIDQDDVPFAYKQLLEWKNDPRSEKLINSGIKGISISKKGGIFLTTARGKVYHSRGIDSKFKEIKLSKSWLKNDEENQPQLDRISFFNENICFISGYIPTGNYLTEKDGIIRSNDGGHTWEKISFGGDQWIYDSFVTNDGQSWIGGSSGTIYYSSNYGINWRPLLPKTFNSSTRMHRIFMKDSNIGVAGALANEIKITKNNWETFSSIETPLDQGKVKEQKDNDSRINNVILFENLIIVAQLGSVFYTDANSISWKLLAGDITRVKRYLNTLYGINADRQIVVFDNQLSPSIINKTPLHSTPVDFALFNGNVFVLDDKYGVYKINSHEFQFVYPEI